VCKKVAPLNFFPVISGLASNLKAEFYTLCNYQDNSSTGHEPWPIYFKSARSVNVTSQA